MSIFSVTDDRLYSTRKNKYFYLPGRQFVKILKDGLIQFTREYPNTDKKGNNNSKQTMSFHD